MDVIWRHTLLLPIPLRRVAVAFRISRRGVNVRLVFWNTELPGHNHTSLASDCCAVVWRSIRISSASRELLHARFTSRTRARGCGAWNTYLRQCLQSESACLRSFPKLARRIRLLLLLLRGAVLAERCLPPRFLCAMAVVLDNVFAASLED